MYSVGIFSESEKVERPYLDVLEKLNFQIESIHLNNIEHKQGELNMLIIDEAEIANHISCYEMILKVRNYFEGYLLLLTKNTLKTIDLVCLQLGIDGIVREDIDYEVTFIQIKRMLDLIQKNEDDKTKKQTSKTDIEGLILNPQNLSVLKNGTEEIGLTNTEYRMLTLLIDNAGRTLSYEELYQKIWQREKYENDNYRYLVTNVAFKLRIKIGRNQQGSGYIQTIRTRGYMFNLLKNNERD